MRQGVAVGLIVTQSPEDVKESWMPILEALQSHLGIEVRANISRDYAGVIWALRSGRNQIAWLGNKAAIKAVDNADAEVFMQTVHANNESGYRSYLIARSDSALHSLDDVFRNIAELTLGTGDTNSTSGYLVPGYYLFAKRRIKPHDSFKRVVQNNHEDNLVAVLDGQLDVATVSSIVFEQFIAQHPDRAREAQILWESPLIPSDPLLWRTDLPAHLKREIRSFFINYGRPAPNKTPDQVEQEQRVLQRSGKSRFVPSNNNQLIPVRRLELFRNRLLVEGNTAITPEARLKRLADIDRQLDMLD